MYDNQDAQAVPNAEGEKARFAGDLQNVRVDERAVVTKHFGCGRKRNPVLVEVCCGLGGVPLKSRGWRL